VLVKIEISAWAAREKCKAAAVAGANAGGADTDRVEAFLIHVPKEERESITKVVNEARNWYADETHYWDGGSRLITNVQYDRVMSVLKKMELKFKEEVGKFLDRLPELEAAAAGGQGAYGGRFPSRSQVERKFKFEITRSAVPNTNDIRLRHVSPEVAREIESSTKAMQAKVVTEAMTRLMARVQTVIGHFTAKMDEPDRSGWHPTTITNVVELAKIIPELNLTGDATLNRMSRDMIETFSGLDAKALKKDGKARAAAKAKATSLLDAVTNMKVTGKI
jgi:hypothetical protein